MLKLVEVCLPFGSVVVIVVLRCCAGMTACPVAGPAEASAGVGSVCVALTMWGRTAAALPTPTPASVPVTTLCAPTRASVSVADAAVGTGESRS